MSEQVISLTENHAQVDWSFPRGNTFFREFSFRRRDISTGVKTPIDLTGSTFVGLIKTNRGVLVDTIEIGNGITVFGDDSESLRLHRAGSVTEDWPDDCPITLTLTWTKATIPEIIQDIIVAKL